MARAYHIAAVSLATGCESKWLDNLLSRHRLRGVERERQGVTRSVSLSGLVHIAITHRLIRELSMPAARAVEVAAQLCAGTAGEVVLGSGLTLQLDVPRLQRELERKVREAAEVVVAPRRGRPPRRVARSRR